MDPGSTAARLERRRPTGKKQIPHPAVLLGLEARCRASGRRYMIDCTAIQHDLPPGGVKTEATPWTVGDSGEPEYPEKQQQEEIVRKIESQ
ncbi:MAG: hypothetical protein ACLU9S_01295 [Oscillospiraceae bacterium]